MRPRWILSHLLVLLLVIMMINLGFWQLRRLHERKTYNASVRANESQPAQPVEDVLHSGDPVSVGHDLNFRRVAATGTYDTSNEIIVRARSLNGTPGVWALTPLRLADGTGVVVLRGFLPSQGTLERVPADAEPPAGQVSITGLVQETQTRGAFGADRPGRRRLATMARADVARIAEATAVSDPAGVRATPDAATAAARSAAHGSPRARARRRAAPQLRRPVVHLHDHRHRRAIR